MVVSYWMELLMFLSLVTISFSLILYSKIYSTIISAKSVRSKTTLAKGASKYTSKYRRWRPEWKSCKVSRQRLSRKWVVRGMNFLSLYWYFHFFPIFSHFLALLILESQDDRKSRNPDQQKLRKGPVLIYKVLEDQESHQQKSSFCWEREGLVFSNKSQISL